MIDNTKEYILCAAVKRNQTRKTSNNVYHKDMNDILKIELGYRHSDIYCRFGKQLGHDQGFYTSRGRYVDRYEAMKIAVECGQVSQEVAYYNSSDLSIVSKQIQDKKLTELARLYNPLFSEDLY